MSKIEYQFYPKWMPSPAWVTDVVTVFINNQDKISTTSNELRSNEVLEAVRSDLEILGFEVEKSGSSNRSLARPVYFGRNGNPERQYQIDAYNISLALALEIEAGRAIMGNAIYRDIIQMSLMLDVEFGVIACPINYRYYSDGKAQLNKSFEASCSIIDAIYASARLNLPFKGLLLLGY